MQEPDRRNAPHGREWLGQTRGHPTAGRRGELSRRAQSSIGRSTARGRRRWTHFDERLATASELVGLTAEDNALIAESRAQIASHIPEIAEEVYRALLSQPETAAHFSDADGAVDRALVGMRRDAFEGWLLVVVEEPLDEETADFLASVGHAHVRREAKGDRIKARYMVSMISRVLSAFIAILADGITDPAMLGACSAAWSKRLFMHLDLLLAVYGSTESSAHWY